MPAPFQLVASHPVLDFVNTLDNRFLAEGPQELLADFPALMRFMRQANLWEGQQANLPDDTSSPTGVSSLLRKARQLRELLADIFYGITRHGQPPAQAFKILQKYCQEAQRHKELVWKVSASEGTGVAMAAWEWSKGRDHGALPVWILAEKAAELLTSPAWVHVHECQSDTCRWLFLDTSKNHSRRWCDMTICGNRTKVRRFLARQR